jgi:chemotaxis protein CheD
MTKQQTQQRADIVLGLGELRAARGEDTVLISLGLGSCVALCAYDPVSKVGGMAHMVLPRSSEGRSDGRNSKFVDHAIPMLIEEMLELGAIKSRMIVKITGGGQMIATQSRNGLLDIGDRNVESTRAVLADLGLSVQADETGGTHGRTARLYLGSGKLLVSAVGGASREL